MNEEQGGDAEWEAAAVQALEEVEAKRPPPRQAKSKAKMVYQEDKEEDEDAEPFEQHQGASDDEDADENHDDGNESYGDDDDDEDDGSSKKKPTTTKSKRTATAAGMETPVTKPKKTKVVGATVPKTKTVKDAGGADAATTTTSTTKITKVVNGSEELTVFKYLETANRPYNSTAIFENLHRAISKPKLQKSLDDLVAADKICETGETSKIYWVNQNVIAMPTAEEDAAMQTNLVELDAKCKNLVTMVATIKNDVTTLESQPTNTELPKMVQDLQHYLVTAQVKVDEYQASLKSLGGSSSSLSSSSNGIDVVDVKTLTQERDFYQKFVKSQKSVVMGVLGDLSSMGDGKDVRVLAAEAGVDLD